MTFAIGEMCGMQTACTPKHISIHAYPSRIERGTHLRPARRPARHAQERELRPCLAWAEPPLREAQRLRHPLADDLVERRLRAAREPGHVEDDNVLRGDAHRAGGVERN